MILVNGNIKPNEKLISAAGTECPSSDEQLQRSNGDWTVRASMFVVLMLDVDIVEMSREDPSERLDGDKDSAVLCRWRRYYSIVS